MILVVGATGTLGGLVTRHLVGQRRPLRVLVRGAHAVSGTPAGFDASVASSARGDLRDPSSLARAMDGVRTVVTTANSALRGGDDTVDSVDRDGNRALIDAACNAGVRHFVFVSALGASIDSPVPFLRAKAETEAHLRASGLSYSIIAPNVFMDVWVPAVVGRPARAGEPVTLVGEGQRRHSQVAIRDVAAFTAAAVDHPAAHNATVTIGGPEAITWREVVAVYEAEMGRPIELRSVSPGTPIAGLPDPMPAFLAAFDTYDSPIEMETLAATFGVILTPLLTIVREDLAK